MAETRRRNKVTIVGAGSVGATTAYACLIRGVAHTLALYDLDAKKAKAEVLDLAHGLQFVPMTQVIGGDDIEVARDSDVIVITAGAKQRPGQTRLDLVSTNVGIMKKLVPSLLEVAPNADILMVSNPCDVLTYAALKISGLPTNRVLGSGTVLDSSRLRFLLAEHAGVAVRSVHAYIAGEHGDTEVAIWSSATIGTVPVREWVGLGGRGKLTEDDLANIHARTVNAAYAIIEGKGATWYAVGLAVARILEALLNDEHTILPVSSLLTDYKGISDVCLSVPSVVTRQGVALVPDSPMNASEITALRASASTLQEIARGVGL
jgi:L-lactate dehydrogenase